MGESFSVKNIKNEVYHGFDKDFLYGGNPKLF
jgi:hypothetical protein